MAPKTRAEIQRDYREEKKQEGVAKKTRKTRIEIQRAYREWKKLEGDKTFLQREREQKSRESLGNSQAEEIKQGKGEALQGKRNTNQTISNFDKRCEPAQNDDCEDGFQSDKNGQVSHNSRVFISHELGHNSATVLAFIKELVPHFKKVMLAQTKHSHYYTDSPPLNAEIEPYFTAHCLKVFFLVRDRRKQQKLAL